MRGLRSDISGLSFAVADLVNPLMFPMLLLMYGRLAVIEEAQMRAHFGAKYDSYAQRTARFFPHINLHQFRYF